MKIATPNWTTEDYKAEEQLAELEARQVIRLRAITNNGTIIAADTDENGETWGIFMMGAAVIA